MTKSNLTFTQVVTAPFMYFFIGLLMGAFGGGVYAGYKLIMLLIQQLTGTV